MDMCGNRRGVGGVESGHNVEDFGTGKKLLGRSPRKKGKFLSQAQKFPWGKLDADHKVFQMLT
jgi:hypothetical protein